MGGFDNIYEHLNKHVRKCKVDNYLGGDLYLASPDLHAPLIRCL